MPWQHRRSQAHRYGNLTGYPGPDFGRTPRGESHTVDNEGIRIQTAEQLAIE